MRIRVVSDVLENQYDGHAVTGGFAKNYMEASESYIVPGVTSWDNVQTEMPDPATIVLTADVTTLGEVPAGDASGQDGRPVDASWVREYILGADAYWLIPGALRATEVTVSD
ncbi:hypothetical protein SEA_GALACTICA_63 [Streptomyces phage Galactica]|nr:hypothetical protein SEA_GALACTICA_63 [Streptomyces phage Galactica]